MKKTWPSILIATIVIAIVFCLALAGGVVYWISQHVHRESSSAESAAAQFGRARARFAGQSALVEMKAGSDAVVRDVQASPPAHSEVTSIHLLVYSPGEEEIVQASFPFWVYRLAPPGSRFGVSIVDADSALKQRIRVSPADIERRGPGLIFESTDIPVSGARMLLWAE
jgi:hypothetical protein